MYHNKNHLINSNLVAIFSMYFFLCVLLLILILYYVQEGYI